MKTSFWWEFVPIGEKKIVIKTLVNEGKSHDQNRFYDYPAFEFEVAYQWNLWPDTTR